jgi:GTP-binding protein Era
MESRSFTTQEDRMSGGERAAFKSGFISIIGKPNVGKSTLLNKLLGRKIAPVSRKPQTTRQALHGIRTDENSQLIFIDTPGIHRPRDPLGQAMVASAKKTFVEADLVYCMVEARLPDDDDERVLTDLAPVRAPIFLLMNKIDRLADKGEMLPLIDDYHRRFSFREIIPISAFHSIQLDVLLAKTKECLPEGPHYYPDDMISDQPLTEIVKEFIREKVIRFTGEEIPYETAVAVEELKQREDGLVEIRAVIYVDRDSQKGILIGGGGAKIKQIGREARLEIEHYLAKHVFLDLWVKVLHGWKKDPRRLKQLGYAD